MTLEDERLKMLWKDRNKAHKWVQDNIMKEVMDKISEINDEILFKWNHKITFGTYPRDEQELYKRIFLRVEVEKKKEDLLKLMNKQFSRLCPEMYEKYESEEINGVIWFKCLLSLGMVTGIGIINFEDILNLPNWCEAYIGWKEGELKAQKTQILCELAERGHKDQNIS